MFWPFPPGSPPEPPSPSAEIEVSVRSERELPPVVVGVWLVPSEEDPLRSGIEQRRPCARGRGRELGEHGVAGEVGVVDERTRHVRPTGVKRQPEEALLVVGEDAIADVEGHRRLAGRRVERHHPPGALVHEQGAVGYGRDADRVGDAPRHHLEPQRRWIRGDRRNGR